MSTGTDSSEVWRCPPGRGEISDDGHRYRVTWEPSHSTTKTALFRVSTDDRVCVLQHIRTVTTSQRRPSAATIDDTAALDDVPEVDPDPKLANVMRPDEVEAGLTQEEALRNAPETEDGYFKGPNVS